MSRDAALGMAYLAFALGTALGHSVRIWWAPFGAALVFALAYLIPILASRIARWP